MPAKIGSWLLNWFVWWTAEHVWLPLVLVYERVVWSVT